MQKKSEIFKKYKSLILYAVFGILTTAVNYLVYFPLFYVAGFTATLSNVIAWFLAVLFSFFTNKQYVFERTDWSFISTLRELVNFFCCRLLTGALETFSLYILVDVLVFDGFIWKIIISIAVVVLNYICSRLFVFKK